MIPVTLRIHGGSGTKEFHYEVLNNPRLSPVAMMATVFNALHGVNEFGEEITYRLNGTIDVKGFPEVGLCQGVTTPRFCAARSGFGVSSEHDEPGDQGERAADAEKEGEQRCMAEEGQGQTRQGQRDVQHGEQHESLETQECSAMCAHFFCRGRIELHNSHYVLPPLQAHGHREERRVGEVDVHFHREHAATSSLNCPAAAPAA